MPNKFFRRSELQNYKNNTLIFFTKKCLAMEEVLRCPNDMMNVLNRKPGSFINVHRSEKKGNSATNTKSTSTEKEGEKGGLTK